MTMEPFDPRDPAGRADLTGRADPSSARLDRMRNARTTAAAPAPRPVFAWALTAVLLAFALGLIANPWFERSVRSRLPGFAPTVAPTRADLTSLETRIATLEARPALRVSTAVAVDPANGERIARVEGALATITATAPDITGRTDKLATDLAALTARVDATAATTAATLDSATATATRAQALLVAGAVRRQLAGGARLGALEPALRRNFSARAAPQVEAVAALGAAPVTLAGLRSGLLALRPALTGTATGAAGSGRDWWSGFRDAVTGIVVSPSPATGGNSVTTRIDRALADLTAGDVTAAVAEVDALPASRRPAAAWRNAAERYQAGWRAMTALETMLLDPLTPGPERPGVSR